MRNRLHVFALLPVLLVATPALAVTWNVPGDFPTIQQAINASSSGDIIIVAPGVYPENITVGAPQNGIKIHSSGGAAVTTIDGGGVGTVASFASVGITTELIGFTLTNGNGTNGGGLSLVNANPKIDSNFITGNTAKLGGGIYANHSQSTINANQITFNAASVAGGAGGGLYLDNASLATITNDVISSNSTVGSGGGFFIQAASNANINNNSVTNNSAGVNGGGLSITGSTTSPTIKNNVISSNHADAGNGGGLNIVSSAFPTVSNNQINFNTALTTGGVHLVGSSPIITNNNIQDNAAPTGSGGGLSCNAGSSPVVTGNLLIRNFAGTNGGGLYANGSVLTLTSNTLALNSGAADGGGVYVANGARVTLKRDIISHSPVGNGVSVDANPSSFVSLTCCDVWGNTAANYSGTPDVTGVNNNISADPFYCDIFGLDFHLFAASPCTAANAPSCGLIGALDVGCSGPVRTETKTWGSIKATYR
ncbi:MAG TPA: right-handed parallel beta-helix repeat-containing protein [Candidatus Eisenbacteria bacterium]|jgi:predicted outer membrane repeat protein|nr:right-handed parallel beta-helix repeat-containing protein [Candidatus Eisenbacteria bacterium]